MIPFWSWLDRHPAAFLCTALLPTLGLIWMAWRAPAVRETPTWRSRWAYPLLLLLTLLAWRWPQLINHAELNPDESQFIAGALTLRHDPVFWRAVDGMTSGPLVSFALVPLTWVGLPVDFLTARLTGLLALWLTFTLCYRLLLAHYHRRAASLGLLGAALFFASVSDPDFNHYNSELIPLLLLAVSAAALWTRQPPSRALLFLGGVAAGLTPWAKLQSAPIAAVIVLVALVRLGTTAELAWRERAARMALLIGGALLPAGGFIAMVWHAGIMEDFYRSYIVQNFLYADPTSLRALKRGSRYLRLDFAVVGYLVVIAAGILAGLAAHLERRRRGASGPSLLSPAALLLLASVICVFFPGRDFLHYTFLLLPGVILLHGAALGECTPAVPETASWRTEESIALAAVASLAVLHVGTPLPPLWGQLANNARFPVSELGAIARMICATDPTLSVWGWQHEVYVEAGARQGTRSAYTYWEIVQHPQRDYFRRRYLADFTLHRPAVFVDAVGESTFFFSNRAAAGHETFPELAAVVAHDYCLIAELRYARLYARRDLLERQHINQQQIWRASLSGAPSDYLDAAENQDLNRFPLPKDTVDGRFAMVMRPPAAAIWTLAGTEREFRLLYGYLPEALKHREGNGTELIVTLTGPDGTARTLTRFLYDPAHESPERSPLPLRVLLPPGYPPGSQLKLETTPGPANDEAWDWLYVTRVGILHYNGFLPRQFPAFNRPPDEVDAPLATLDGPPRAPTLLLHAPARLRFRLGGHERALEFTYGFRPGAFTAGGQTDGAIFRVLALPPGRPPKVLFERDLDPVRTPADRPRQRSTVPLPALEPGTTLELVVDPKGSNAWDWTFVDSLRLG